MPRRKSDPLDAMVGAKVRVFRINRGISQTALAEKLGVTFQQVQKYEKGANRIGASRLQQISRILQVPVAFFFDAVSQLPPSVAKDQPLTELTEFMATRDGLALAQAFMRIDSMQLRRRLVELVEQIEQSQA
jgi:transcriptional regulator with XRE-family HTH domain